MALWTGCIAGALTQDDCLEGLSAAGFTDPSIEPTTAFGRAELEDLVAGLDPRDVPADLDIEAAITELDVVIHSASIRATKPGSAALEIAETGCCGPAGCC